MRLSALLSRFSANSLVIFWNHRRTGMGKRVKLSNGRRLVNDVIEMSIQMPLATVAGTYEAPLTAKFRRRTRPKIGWNILYMKAYASVCQKNPTLRQSYVRFPWGHLYQHDYNVCLMTVAREYQGEERLFFARFNRPDDESLEDLQLLYDHYRQSPIEEIKQFRHQIKFAKLPRLVRRFGWWALFNIWPQKRASHMGTFGMTLSGYRGAYGSGMLGPNTTTLGVDPLPRKGTSKILLSFDHRVIDGTPACKTLQQLNHILNTAIREELADMIRVHPETGRDLSEIELEDLEKRQRAKRVLDRRQVLTGREKRIFGRKSRAA